MNDEPTDVLIVGAGLAGVYAIHRFRELGFTVRCFEAASGVGGTWFWNRYPGARCDIESLEYSYQFSEALQQEWEWTERYATQPELLRYIEHVADRFDVRRDIEFETRVESARWSESERLWTLGTSRGERARGRFCVLATGPLSIPNVPEIPGLDTFAGPAFHTARWPASPVELEGKRVGVVGTGSSGIQCIPEIAQRAASLTVFQRTPVYTLPAQNAALDPQEVLALKADYAGFRKRNRESFFGMLAGYEGFGPSVKDAAPDTREAAFESAWSQGRSAVWLNTFEDLMADAESNAIVADWVDAKIRDRVDDPETARALTPDSIFGCKRLCLDTDYYETYNRAHVSLVPIRDNPIERIEPGHLVLADGTAHALDVLVFATGFDAMTGAALAIDPVGRGGRRLHDVWADGPRAFLGLAVPGLPNLFTVAGPGSPSVFANMVPGLEQHVNWIGDCFEYLRAKGYATIEATERAALDWGAEVADAADMTLFPHCDSWYLGANIPGKPRVFLPYIGYAPYVERCDQVASEGYAGFTLER